MKKTVYRIHCKANGKSYVGITSNLEHRWRDHKWHLNRGEHFIKALQIDWIKYKIEEFEFSILEEVEGNEAEMKIAESTWIEELQTYARKKGYNVDWDRIKDESELLPRGEWNMVDSNKKRVGRPSKKIIVIDVMNDKETEYSSTKEVKEKLGIAIHNIYNCMSKKHGTYINGTKYKFRWK